MKAKHSTLVILSVFFSLTLPAQLKVDVLGNIGLGTLYPNSGYRCHIKGDLLLTNWPTTPWVEFKFKVGNGSPGAEIGSSVDKIAFWETNTGYNQLYAQSYSVASDQSLKTNIKPIEGGLAKVLQLKVYSYLIEDEVLIDDEGNKTFKGNTKYGFLSQEVEKTLSEVSITSDLKGIKLMDYNQITPLLVSSTIEQQNIINTLQEQINSLKNQLNTFLNTPPIPAGGDTKSSLSSPILFQNNPNPFYENTIVKYEINVTVQSASILVFDMNGTLLKTYEITSGKGELIIHGTELEAGMYLYSLIVNNKEMDTKKMILLK